MAYWVAFDFSTDDQHNNHVLGIFTDQKRADEVAKDHEQRMRTRYGEGGKLCWWMRQFGVVEVTELDTVDRIDYESADPWRDRWHMPREQG